MSGASSGTPPSWSSCWRGRSALGGGTEAAQQRVHGQRHDAQHRDLAEGIEAAEIHQDHVDHVGAAAVRQRALDEVRGDRVALRPRQHRVGQRRHAAAGGHGHQQVAQAAAARLEAAPGALVILLDAARQPAQAQQQQDQCHHLDRQLRQRQVRRREPDEGQAGHQARAARQRQRGQPVVLGLIGRRHRADAAHQPQQGEGRVHRGQMARAIQPAAGAQRQPRHEQRAQHDQQHLHLQARGRQPAQQPGRRHAGAVQQRLEAAPAVEAVDEGHAAGIGLLVRAQRQVQHHARRHGDHAS